MPSIFQYFTKLKPKQQFWTKILFEIIDRQINIDD